MVLTDLLVAPGTGPDAGFNLVTITGAGTPGLLYIVECSTDLTPAGWSTAAFATADSVTGVLNFLFTHPQAVPTKFFRLRLP